MTTLFLRTWQEDEDLDRIERAARTAASLELPHLLLDVREAFYEDVVLPFVQAWREGLTPNPCVFCNPEFKFFQMASLAEELACDFIATGHYARLGREEGKTWLYRSSDRRQDQSYFLYRLPAHVLDMTLFPLGGKTKKEARQIASLAGDPSASARDSQDICFMAGGRLRDFLSRQGLEDERGDFVDRQGRVLGSHLGAWKFTVGQRRHLGQAFGRRMTVIGIDSQNNQVILGDEEEALMEVMKLDHCHFTHPLPPALDLDVQLRSQGMALPARLTLGPKEGEAQVSFKDPVRLSSPGQSAVFYHKDRLLGGGLVREMA